MIYEFDYEDTANQVSDDELGIGTATRLLLIEESDELEGKAKERNYFLFVRKFYVESVCTEARVYKRREREYPTSYCCVQRMIVVS